MTKQSWSAITRQTNWRWHRAKKQENPRYIHRFQTSSKESTEYDRVSFDWIHR
ncbi:hypothetical protein [Flectobacillus major]|jgi:hypothetical protein|uniref:hypothetical protein n=1 Tax=Flectobacillus major TaxID=103 RepID=UPI00131F318A|nr:hypothetical protein [Flectobacillus major]